MNLYLIAGELSGDAHGADLMCALLAREPGLRFSGCGGPRMAAIAGGDFLDWSGEAVVGLWDVLRKYPYFKRRFHETLAEVETLHPNAVVFIDYPGFNLRVAKALRTRMPDLRLIYYISPQVWAWHRGRIKEMARTLDLMLCIFPFEKEMYEDSGLKTVFVGHPLKQKLATETSPLAREDALLGLFPGSREREVRKIFPPLLGAAALLTKTRPALRVEAAAATGALAAMMRSHLDKAGVTCEIRVGESRALMQRATAGIVASGTATLEAAFFGLPFAITYRVAPLTWWIGKRLVQVPHLGMPNLLAGREIVPEFLQDAAHPAALADAVGPLLDDPARRDAMRGELRAVVEALGEGGCSERAAEAVLGELHGA